MIVDPPLLIGGDHENPIDVEVVLPVISVKPVGGLGTVGRIVSENVNVLSYARPADVVTIIVQVKLPT